MKKLICLATIIALFGSCTKSSSSSPATLATITTASASAITSAEATSGGNITSDGGAAITERGICFNATTIPTTSNNKVATGNGTGAFSAKLTGIAENTIYYTRAYAINSAGVSYGQEVQFPETNKWMKKVNGPIWNNS